MSSPNLSIFSVVDFVPEHIRKQPNKLETVEHKETLQPSDLQG